MALCRQVFHGRAALFERMVDAYTNAGIETRSSCVPIEWYAEPHGWVERMALFEEHALSLTERAARQVVDHAGIGFEDVDAIVSVTTTGISTPSLEALLIDRLGLRRDVARLPIFGLGCAGGVSGLARAGDLARSLAMGRGTATVLMVGVELCALTFRAQELSKANIIASALFGDGGAAILLRVGEEGDEAAPTLTSNAEFCWPDSRDVMGWRIEEDGFGVIFSRDIPSLVKADFGAAARDFLEAEDVALADLSGYIMHPGGTKVLAAYEDSFALPPDALRHSRDVLRDFGNMSSVTVLSVLERTLFGAEARAGAPRRSGPYLMAALGPGFTAAMNLVSVP